MVTLTLTGATAGADGSWATALSNQRLLKISSHPTHQSLGLFGMNIGSVNEPPLARAEARVYAKQRHAMGGKTRKHDARLNDLIFLTLSRHPPRSALRKHTYALA